MVAPPSASARKRQATCNAVLDATSQIIAEKGVDGFAISEVAQRAGINRALIYHYFQNRDNLVVQGIDHVLQRYDAADAELSVQSVERGVRMHIEHPEIGRLFFQFLLNGRPLLRLGQRITDTIAALERLQQERAPDATYDSAFALITLVLAQLSWAFSRQEFARLLGISLDEADERFIAYLRSSAGAAIAAMMGTSDQKES